MLRWLFVALAEKLRCICCIHLPWPGPWSRHFATRRVSWLWLCIPWYTSNGNHYFAHQLMPAGHKRPTAIRPCLSDLSDLPSVQGKDSVCPVIQQVFRWDFLHLLVSSALFVLFVFQFSFLEMTLEDPLRCAGCRSSSCPCRCVSGKRWQLRSWKSSWNRREQWKSHENHMKITWKIKHWKLVQVIQNGLETSWNWGCEFPGQAKSSENLGDFKGPERPPLLHQCSTRHCHYLSLVSLAELGCGRWFCEAPWGREAAQERLCVMKKYENNRILMNCAK